MRKITALLLILTMAFALSACSKSENAGSGSNTDTVKIAETTKAPEVTKEAETTKAPEVTKEPETTPAPVETTPEPTEEPEIIDDSGLTDIDEEDEFYSPGHEYAGTYISDNYTLIVSPEGAGDILEIYFGRNGNKEEWEGYYQYWANYYGDDTFRARIGYYIFPGDSPETLEIEDEEIFTISGDKILWTTCNDEEFVRATEEDFIEEDLPMGTGFGAEMYREENVAGLDFYAITFLGVYAENTEDPDQSYYFDYADDEISFDNMDEFNCAFLYLTPDDTEDSQLCFLEKGINSVVDWRIKNGTLKVETEDGAYFGEFYFTPDGDEEYGNLYVCLHIDEYNVWLID